MAREVTNIQDAQVGDVLTPAQIVEAATGEKPGIEEAKKRVFLEYPLNNPDEYKGRIVFNVMQEPETDLGNLAGAITGNIKRIINKVASDPEQSPEEESQSFSSFDGELNVPIINERPLIDLDRQVSLYLPIGLQYRDNVQYENFDLGGIGAGAEKGVTSGTGAIKGLIEGGMKTLTAGLTGGSSGADVAKLGVVKLASALPDEVQGAFKDTDSTENDLVNEAQNIMGKLSGTGLDPANLMKNMNLDMDKFADIFNKGK